MSYFLPVLTVDAAGFSETLVPNYPTMCITIMRAGFKLKNVASTTYYSFKHVMK